MSELTLYKIDTELVFANANSVLQNGLLALRNGCAGFDFSALAKVDSSAVAVMLAWARAAKQQGLALNWQALPDNLQSLLKLYGLHHHFSSHSTRH